jgi:hypothetical protein
MSYDSEEKKKKKWFGTWPANCDLCESDLNTHEYFVDGRTIFGPWALMCPRCHLVQGGHFGTGIGQKYDSKTLEKMEG